MELAMDLPTEPSSFNLQLFFDHVYNAAYDIFEDSFDTLEETVPLLLGNPSQETLKATSKGFDAVFNTVQAKLEKNLNRWEVYCRANCFAIPNEASHFQENAQEHDHLDASISSQSQEELVDAELESVRSQLHAAGKESARIRRELRSLERFFAAKKKREEALQDAVMQLKEEDHQNMFEEILRIGNLLREKLKKVKAERIQSPRGVRLTRSDCAAPEEIRDLDFDVRVLHI